MFLKVLAIFWLQYELEKKTKMKNGFDSRWLAVNIFLYISETKIDKEFISVGTPPILR